ncbi:hypothetical protein [Paenibacillus sp. MMO-177]|uniref:hypothetical protein n=1 Tax=Paenibacillus sp. MMO-177 TaxID=3081289 RepID=UPI0030170652
MARSKRPKMETKEELVAYLEANQEIELPFNEEVWDKAVDATADKDRKFKEIKTTDFEGKEVTKKIPNGSVSPVGKYFQMMALPQYRNPVDTSELDDDWLDEESETELDFDDEEKEETVSTWIQMFFDGIGANDRKFVVDRLSNYYDNYELNEGADKFQAAKAVLDELEMRNLIKMRNKGKDVEARIEKCQKSYLALLDSLKAQKKQRGAGDDEGKNKFTLFVDELEKEGRLVEKKDTSYTSDDIDRLLVEFEQSMRTVYYEG